MLVEVGARDYGRGASGNHPAAHPRPETDMTTETPTYREYWASVNAMADHVVETVCEYGADPTGTIHQTVDGSGWVIYCYRARFTLLYSDNEDVIFDLGADLSGVESMGDIRTRAAYHALHADICEALDRRGYDFSDDADSWREVRDDSGEE